MGIFRDIIKEDSYLFKEDVSNDEFNYHHTIPLTIKIEILRKIAESKNRKKSGKKAEIDRICLLLSRIDVDNTKKILKKLHYNFNYIFKVGDLLPTEVLGKLKFEILREDYQMCDKKEKNGNRAKTENGNGGKKKDKIVRFFFYASKFNNISYSEEEIKRIDKKLSKRCVTPKELLKYFKMSSEDIVFYLEDNFLYPGYNRFYEVWEMLSNNGHRKGRGGASMYHSLFVENQK
ncbi:MAG: hypothetical protein P1P85_02860 [Patescibacteria group bacterium]|nr:hypothetical protein [Patescibacteria group bacterium]